MDSLFIDTDVILDFMTGREPFAIDAAKIFSLSENKAIYACTSPLVFANAYYVLRKLGPHKKVIEKLLQLSGIIDINGLSKAAVLSALRSGFHDFEDALQNFAAVEGKLRIIVTRNNKDYRDSELAVMTPEIYLRQKTA